jgi:hypothetical protein
MQPRAVLCSGEDTVPGGRHECMPARQAGLTIAVEQRSAEVESPELR